MMLRWRRSERLARALDEPGTTVDDPATRSAIRAADALTPSIAPRESWRTALKERVLREAQRDQSTSDPAAGTRDGDALETVHTTRLAASDDTSVVLADVEEIDERRAREVAAKLTRIARAFSPEEHRR